MNTPSLFATSSDDEVIAEAKRLVACERAATAALLQSLMEIDTRRLYLREGCSSPRRQVWQRDQGRCAFVGTSGRCRETGFLEVHHVEPYAEGGLGTIDNIQLRCRAQPLRGVAVFR